MRFKDYHPLVWGAERIKMLAQRAALARDSRTQAWTGATAAHAATQQANSGEGEDGTWLVVGLKPKKQDNGSGQDTHGLKKDQKANEEKKDGKKQGKQAKANPEQAQVTVNGPDLTVPLKELTTAIASLKESMRLNLNPASTEVEASKWLTLTLKVEYQLEQQRKRVVGILRRGQDGS